MDLQNRLALTKKNYKRLWEDQQELRKAYNNAIKGTEQIEQSIDSLIGTLLLPYGGKAVLKKEDLVKKYQVIITNKDGDYVVESKELNL